MKADHQSRSKSWAFRIIAVGWTALVALLLFKIGTGSTQIGAPATESEAIVRTNERLLEVVQWTISTILLVGGGLIGLNWYQNEKRVEEEFRRFQGQIDRIDNRTNVQRVSTNDQLSFTTERIAEVEKSLFMVRSHLEQSTLSFYGYGKDRSWGEAILEALIRNPNYPEFVIVLVENFARFLETQDVKSSFVHYLAKDQMLDIAAHMDLAKRPDLAATLRSIHNRM